MKRIVSVLLIAVMITGCFCSCSERGSGKSIVYPMSKSPSTLDPQYCSESSAQLIINNIFEGLVRYDGEGNIIPGIAESWEISSDGLTYTFRLKEATEWYCPISMKTEFGEEFYKKYSEETVKADDFVYACERTLDPAVNSPLSSRMFVIKNAADVFAGKADFSALGVTAPDDNTVVFTLREKCDDFLDRLTESEFMPCNREFFEAMNGRYGLTARHILCNGPFYLSSWDSSTSMTIKINKCYAGEQTVNPASVLFSFGNDSETVLKKLGNGSLSAALLPAGTALPENAKAAGTIENTVYGFAFNCEDELLKNLDLRLALCRSIDADIFSPEGKDKKYDLVPGCCKAGNRFYCEAVSRTEPVIAYNEKSAEAAWKAALKELDVTSVSLTVICPENLDNAVREQLQIWQKIFGMYFGISVTTMTEDEIQKATKTGDYQIAYTKITTGTESAPEFLIDMNDGGIFGFDTYEYEKITDRLAYCDSNEDILSGCLTAELYILEKGAFYPLCSDSAIFAMSEDTDGITIFSSEKTISFIGARRFD